MLPFGVAWERAVFLWWLFFAILTLIMNDQSPHTLCVVIPCYNEEGGIAACLDALLVQQDALHEIIAVDNNSTDKTASIVRSYSERYPKIRLVTEPQQGVQFARSRGFDEATGTIIGRIDADTIVDPDWAMQVLQYYAEPENANVGIASGRSWYYDLPFRAMTEYFADLFTQRANQKMAKAHSVYGSNMTLRRETWQKIRSEVCMRFGIMEDQDLAYHVVRAGFITGAMPSVRAGVSGRRMRMSPLRYWKYNKQWWMTYYNHGLYADARKIRVTVWIANALQALAWVGLLFHNPKTNTFGIVRRSDKQEERAIP